MRLNTDQKILLTMMVLVWVSIFTASTSVHWALAGLGIVLVLDVWLILRHVQITIGRWTFGKSR